MGLSGRAAAPAAIRRSRATRRYRWPLAVLAALLAAVALYAGLPRRADLTAFDPTSMGTSEAAMWRDYYDKRYLDLFAHLYGLARNEFGFSPLDSARIALAAARAARAFQPTTSRAEAQSAALPLLIDYYRLLSPAAPVPFDGVAAARGELDWWQARREAVSPERYGLTIAEVTTLLYGVDGDDIRRAGILRAQAMARRDAGGAALTDADWSQIADQLVAAHGLVKRALAKAR
jgi:hypothetical protein